MTDYNNEHDKMTFKTWVINLFEDERERTSIKPVISFLGAVFLCGTMLANSIFPKFVPADFLVDAVMIITAIGMGADSLDKFSFKGRKYSRYGGGYGGGYDDGGYGNYYGGGSDYRVPTNETDENIGPSSNQLL